MTSERICPVHHVPFKRFEKGDQVWFAHKQDNGWCNEEKLSKQRETGAQALAQLQAQTLTQAPPAKGMLSLAVTKPVENEKPIMTKEDWAERDNRTRTSIERQTALKEANSFVCEMRKLQGKPVEGDSGLVVKVACFWEGYLRGDIKYDSKAMNAFLVKMAEEDIKPKPKQETKSKTELPYEKIPY